MLRPPEAIFFDLDDTILDTTLSATRVWRQTALHFEKEIGQPASVFDPILDRARVWYWSDPRRNQEGRLDVQRSRIEVTHHGLLKLGIDRPDLAERFADYYSTHRVSSMQPFPGAIETLQRIHAADIPMALLTNGDAQGQRDKVEHFALAPFFREVLIEGELDYGKPDPRVFHRAAKACGVSLEESWCVGDNLAWEVEAPQRLGMAGIWCDWEDVGLPRNSVIKPDRVVNRISELWPLPMND